jgi:hypothetical protein
MTPESDIPVVVLARNPDTGMTGSRSEEFLSGVKTRNRRENFIPRFVVAGT